MSGGISVTSGENGMGEPTERCPEGHDNWCLRMETGAWFCETCEYDDWKNSNPIQFKAVQKETARVWNALQEALNRVS